MQALTELQTPDIPQPEDPDVVEAEYDVRFCQVLPSIHKYFFQPRNKSLTSLCSLCNRSRTWRQCGCSVTHAIFAQWPWKTTRSSFPARTRRLSSTGRSSTTFPAQKPRNHSLKTLHDTWQALGPSRYDKVNWPAQRETETQRQKQTVNVNSICQSKLFFLGFFCDHPRLPPCGCSVWATEDRGRQLLVCGLPSSSASST